MTAFKKMHGLGNDFVIVDARGGGPLPGREKIAALTDRHTGIGCDQFIIIHSPKNKSADAFMQTLNYPDASEAEACGNATRCVADILINQSGRNAVVIETLAGLLACVRGADGRITVDMGAPRLNWNEIPLARECDTLNVAIDGSAMTATCVNVGNPHAVFFVDDAENFPVREIGPQMETHPIFPNKANIEFAQIIAPDRIRLRVWERAAGETMACGSAACATIVAAVRRGLSDRKATITLNGGDLHLEWRESDDHILMTGPVAYVFEGFIK